MRTSHCPQKESQYKENRNNVLGWIELKFLAISLIFPYLPELPKVWLLVLCILVATEVLQNKEALRLT